MGEGVTKLGVRYTLSEVMFQAVLSNEFPDSEESYRYLVTYKYLEMTLPGVMYHYEVVKPFILDGCTMELKDLIKRKDII